MMINRMGILANSSQNNKGNRTRTADSRGLQAAAPKPSSCRPMNDNGSIYLVLSQDRFLRECRVPLPHPTLLHPLPPDPPFTLPLPFHILLQLLPPFPCLCSYPSPTLPSIHLTNPLVFASSLLP